MSEEIDPRTPLFVQLGKALATWQTMEGLLGHLFWALLGAGDSQTAEIVYSDLPFRRKLAVINKLVKYRVHDQGLLLKWKTLYNALKKQAEVRNNLVHWQFVSLADGSDPTTVTPIIARSFSDMRYIDVSKTGSIEMFKGAMDEKAVAKITAEFSRSLSRVMRIQAPVLRHLASLQKSP